MRYRERLSAPLLWWVIGLAFGLTFVIAVGAILPPEAGVAALVVALALVGGVLLGLAPVVAVTDDAVLAARARLPLADVGSVTVLDAGQVRNRIGVAADPRAYLVYRAYCDGAVEIEVTDAADPHPYWLVSSRDPGTFAAAIEGTRAARANHAQEA